MKSSHPHPITPDGWKLAIALAGNTALLMILYYTAPLFGLHYLPIVYLFAGMILALWYVIYNHGFNTRGKTPDQLPADLPLAERESMIEEGKRRMKRSRWALTLLIPIILTLLCDLLYLFFIPEGLFS